MSKPNFAVCASGRSGSAIAGDIALMGYNVSLFELDRFKENIKPFQEAGGVELSGKTQSGKVGFAKLSRITINPEEAIEDADLIMICSPAFGHETFVETIAPHLKEGQCLMINTGYWGTLRCADLLKKEGVLDKITLAEANIMPYMIGGMEGNHIHILNVKRDIKLATFPAKGEEKIFDIIKLVYPQHKRVPNVLWTGLSPGNPSVHATFLLPVAALPFERYPGCRMYGEATTLGARLIEAFDRERTKVAEALGCDSEWVETSFEWNQKTYGYTGRDIAEAFRTSPHAERMSPVVGLYQILLEDLAYFYVPVSRLADSLGVPTPVITGIPHIMGTMLQINYWEKGVTLEQLGFAGLTADQIVKYVNTGKK